MFTHSLEERGRRAYVGPASSASFMAVSEPGHRGRSYQMTTRTEGDKYVDPETWQLTAPRHEGSWWPAWQGSLARHSGEKIAPPALGAPDKAYAALYDAPGLYVLQK
jgi:polyhydroxyalkanoate synthase